MERLANLVEGLERLRSKIKLLVITNNKIVIEIPEWTATVTIVIKDPEKAELLRRLVQLLG